MTEFFSPFENQPDTWTCPPDKCVIKKFRFVCLSFFPLLVSKLPTDKKPKPQTDIQIEGKKGEKIELNVFIFRLLLLLYASYVALYLFIYGVSFLFVAIITQATLLATHSTMEKGAEGGETDNGEVGGGGDNNSKTEGL